MNKCQLVGRLTKDPESVQTQSGTSMCRFSVALERRFKREGEQQADFPNCVAFGKTADFICQYFFKGKLIGISGHIQTSNYKNQQGQTVYKTDIVVDEAEFVGGKNESGGQQATQPHGQPIEPYSPQDPNFEPMDDAELPF